MKNPVSWRERNNKMSFVCLFWFIVSTIAFVVLKFLYPVALVPFIFLVIYASSYSFINSIFFKRRKEGFYLKSLLLLIFFSEHFNKASLQ